MARCGFARFREVLRQQLRLALGRLGKAFLDNRRDPAMEHLPLAPEQAVVGSIAHQGMLEGIARLGASPRRKISSAATSRSIPCCSSSSRSGATAARSSWENSRPITAAIWATSLASACRSSRAINESCSVAGIASGGSGPVSS